MTATLSPDRVGLPPPLELELMDADRAVGWITRDRVGFRGFANELEAAHAAWLAHRTLARRLARTHGTRPVPIDSEPLARRRCGDVEVIFAGGRPIAALVRPATESRTGPDDFGFELRVPPPADELRVRAMAHLTYRTLRKSGLRWALWRPDAVSANWGAGARTTVDRASDRTSTVNRTSTADGGASNVTERGRRRAWGFSALPWRRAGRLGQGQRSRVPGLR